MWPFHRPRRLRAPERPRQLTPAELLDASIAQRRAERLAKPVPDEAKRFARARPMLDRLRFEIASRQAQA